MGTFSVALFGHYKPRFYLQNKKSGITVQTFVEEPIDFDASKYKLHHCSGWEKRCEPGDIVAFRPIEDADKWTPKERSAFLIVTIDGVTQQQLEGGLTEANWDINSYKEFNPMNPSTFDSFMQENEKVQLLRRRTHKNLWSTFTSKQKDNAYAKYVDNEKRECEYPTDYIKKRRMQISLDMLELANVDLEQMLNPNLFYNPRIDYFTKTDCFDKLNSQNIKYDAQLNIIPKKEVL